MKFWYEESQKPTRDEHSWVIGMAKAGFNINYVAFHFDIHKTITNWIINRFMQTKLAGDRLRSGWQEKITNSTWGTFHSGHINTGDISNAHCITSRNCLWYVSVPRNFPEPSLMHVENVQNIDILSFWKTFYDRHCAPYKWKFAVFGIG